MRCKAVKNIGADRILWSTEKMKESFWGDTIPADNFPMTELPRLTQKGLCLNSSKDVNHNLKERWCVFRQCLPQVFQRQVLHQTL